jgi:signal transduction histidine kinase
MLARLQWSAFGLRGRIVGTVLLTTVVTLGVAGIVLLPRLETALRNASKTALTKAVRAARSEIDQVARIDYRTIALLDLPDRLGRPAAFNVSRELASELGHLRARLGATTVLMIGYIDASGHGRPVLTGPDRDPSLSVGAGSLSDVRQAFFTGRTQYGFGAIGEEQFVRAAVPLPHDDAVLAVRASINQIPQAVRAVDRAFEIAALAGLLLTALLTIPLAATLVRRLQRLREAALRVAVEGIGAEVPVDRARDEIGDLARSFAIMNRRLRHQEEARRAFVATASHELRTPLASLDGMLELLGEDLSDPEPDLQDAKELLERARAQSRRLGRLAADLLDLSRLDAEVTLRSEPVELAELVRAVVAEFELALSERGVGIDLREAGGPVWAQGDPGSIARILRILLDNALRVAPPGSDITIGLSQSPLASLRVTDAGPGVLPEERGLIFERFKRGRDTGGQAGFGLGLAIGRELAERMGGALELADAPQPGATFTLTLPPAAVDPPSARRTDPHADALMTDRTR